MAADTSVKLFHNQITGAPSLSSAAGALISLLDACLVNGWGSGALDSITVASGVATATRSAGHPLQVGMVALIAGATPTALNGEKKVLSRTTTTYTFDATGVTDGTYSGSITHKIAPLGWSKVFTGTNVAVYRSTDPMSTGFYLRVNDTASTARVTAYETMSDVDTGTGQMGSEFYWAKSNYAGAPWMLAGDGRTFYWMPSHTNGYQGIYGTAYAFGDILSTKSPDPFGCALVGQTYDPIGEQPGTGQGDLITSTISLYVRLARSYTGLGGVISVYNTFSSFYGQGSNQSGSTSTTVPTFILYPNPTDGGLYLSRINLVETNGAFRGYMPGLFCTPQRIPGGTFAARDQIQANVEFNSRKVSAVPCGNGVGFIDITGPWR
jgi:hypothetical protein